ncbi:DUF6194 family protein [Kiritimatiellaeota bacterium B1221]|nr:DUF6194 family protein [Kiritimatiellaeota bacterium B1221]
MNKTDFERFIEKLPQVTRADNFGYALFFYRTDQMTPFVSIADTDNEYDDVSDLNREGVFRLNIGIESDTYQKLIAQKDDETDYTQKNVFIPHPHYAAQKFICILNPEGDQFEETKRLIREAHELAKRRYSERGGVV